MLLTTDAGDAQKRLDVFLRERLPEYSRARLQDWIKTGRVRVNGAAQKASYVVRPGETVDVEPAELPPLKAFAEELPLEILYEDGDVIAVNKPAGMVVHAGAGCRSGTLVNALLHRFERLSTVGGDLRPGIIHRLDRFTSGVLLVAKHDAAHRDLASQFAGRQVEKVYVALVQGSIKNDTGRMEQPISRDPARRIRMTAKRQKGRSAVTSYRVLGRFPGFTLLEVSIGTGRTHQIRVHLAHAGHPVAGDTLYGAARTRHGRFFLHAQSITFRSPSSGETVSVAAPVPAELSEWLAELSGQHL
jgi:23S rRNA pseudouridine1911/1915/1917 synthase